MRRPLVEFLRTGRASLAAVLLLDFIPKVSLGAVDEGQPDDRSAARKTDVEPPVLLRFVEARYPEQARKDGLEAEVLLALTIASDGSVSEVEVVTPAGHGFDEAAVRAARQFSFQPATRAGTPIAARIHYRYQFERANDASAVLAGQRSGPASPTLVTLRGRVMAASGAVSIAGAQIEVVHENGTRQLVLSAETGAFELGGLPPGHARVLVRSEGMESVVLELELVPDQDAPLVLELQPSLTDADRIDIRVSEEREPATTKRSLSRRELKSMPGTFGDAMRGLQSMPGVSVAPIGNSALVVRGMGPQTNLVYVDGLLVLNAYHLWGISSVLPTEMLTELEFYPGNYAVDYGRALGGMIEMKTRRISEEDSYHGLAQVDVIDSRLMLEGPVPGLSGWSFLGGVRRSHLDQTAMPVLGFDVSPVYYDYQLFFETRPSRRSRLRVGVFGSSDRLTFGEGYDAVQLESRSSFWYAFSHYDAELSDQLGWEHTLAFGFLRNQFQFEVPGAAISADAPAYPLAVRSALRWQPAEILQLRVGTDLHYAPFDASFSLPELPASDAPPSGEGLRAPTVDVDAHELYFRPGAFAEAALAPNRNGRIVVGIRGDYSHDIEAWDASPRVRASYSLGAPDLQTTLKAGVGLFHQPPQPEEALPGFGSQQLESSRALHGTLGAEQRLFGAIEANVEGYYYWLSKLVERATAEDGNLHFVNRGAGRTFGFESLLRYADPASDFYGWLAYTLARAERRTAPDEEYHLTDFDQTHILTLLGSYRLGRGWELGARFQYASGMPYTPVVDRLYSSSTQAYVPILGSRNSGRLPAFHQLDLRIEKYWQIDWLKLTVYLDLLNANGNRRVTDINYNEDFSASTFQEFPLPMIPSLGLRGEF